MRLDIGIGVNTGDAIVGNIGSLAHKVEYTAVGDTVNVANRLESLNKELGTHIVVSETTRLAAGEGFDFRPLEATKVKGKDQAVQIYELVGRTRGSKPAVETAKRVTSAVLLAIALLAAAPPPAHGQSGAKERWVDFVYRPGRWENRRLVPFSTGNPNSDTLALVARVDTYVRTPRWRAEVQRMIPGDSVAELTVLVGNAESVVVLTATT